MVAMKAHGQEAFLFPKSDPVLALGGSFVQGPFRPTILLHEVCRWQQSDAATAFSSGLGSPNHYRCS